MAVLAMWRASPPGLPPEGGSHERARGSAEPGRSERRQRGEKNDGEHREQPSKDASQQPELTQSQDEQPIPARAGFRRQARLLMTECMCSHMAPRGYASKQSDTVIPGLFHNV